MVVEEVMEEVQRWRWDVLTVILIIEFRWTTGDVLLVYDILSLMEQRKFKRVMVVELVVAFLTNVRTTNLTSGGGIGGSSQL